MTTKTDCAPPAGVKYPDDWLIHALLDLAKQPAYYGAHVTRVKGYIESKIQRDVAQGIAEHGKQDWVPEGG